jgi:transposase
VFKEVGPYRKLREHSRVHTMVVRDSARVQNRIKRFMRSRGVSVEGKTVYGVEGREEYLAKLPEGTRSAVAILYAQYDVLQEVRKRSVKELVTEARLHPASKILATCPGIGAIRAAQLVPIVVTPHRFRTKRQFWSYCGRQDRARAVRHVEHDDVLSATMLAICDPDLGVELRVPSVAHDRHLADMGRMNGDSR